MRHDTPATSPRDLRAFAFTVGGAFVALGVLLQLRGRTAAPALLALGAALVLAGLLVPSRLGPFYRGWMSLALAISRVTTPILMGAIYFLILTPLGAAMRLFGRRPLVRERNATSFWAARPPGERKSDLKRQF